MKTPIETPAALKTTKSKAKAVEKAKEPKPEPELPQEVSIATRHSQSEPSQWLLKYFEFTNFFLL